MRAMVCGGAGYIGSHMCRALLRAGHEVMVVDNLSTGHRQAVAGIPLVEIDILDAPAIHSAVSTWRPDTVFHFAARSIVSDSVADPEGYYLNNVTGTLRLMDAMRSQNVDRMIFSSTAAVYGVPDVSPVLESSPLRPINPYGATKLAVEHLLAAAASEYGLRSVSLRYFNAAGADPTGGIGESHDPETHLIPNALRAASGDAQLKVFGDTYPTPDGTCVRDYVHVNDLARAHLAAANFLGRNTGAHVFNLGSGNGCSVMGIIRAVERVTGRAVPFETCPRRDGDPAQLVASHAAATAALQWSPEISDIDTLVETAWRWHGSRTY